MILVHDVTNLFHMIYGERLQYTVQSKKSSRIPEASHERQQQLEEEVGRLRREKATLESDLLISQDEPEVSGCSTWLIEHICKRVMMGDFQQKHRRL